MGYQSIWMQGVVYLHVTSFNNSDSTLIWKNENKSGEFRVDETQFSTIALTETWEMQKHRKLDRLKSRKPTGRQSNAVKLCQHFLLAQRSFIYDNLAKTAVRFPARGTFSRKKMCVRLLESWYGRIGAPKVVRTVHDEKWWLAFLPAYKYMVPN